MQLPIVVGLCCWIFVASDVAGRYLDEKPLFCRIVVGTEPAIEFLAGFKGNELLIYRDGSHASMPESYRMSQGKLSDANEIPVFKYGSTFFQITHCHKHVENEPEPRTSMMLHGTIRDAKLSFSQYCDVTLQPLQSELKNAHFDGPLKVGIQKNNWKPIPIEFVIGGQPTDIRVTVDTTDKEKGCWTTLESGSNKICRFEDGVRPVAIIAFPTNDSTKPIIKRYELDQFC